MSLIDLIKLKPKIFIKNGIEMFTKEFSDRDTYLVCLTGEPGIGLLMGLTFEMSRYELIIDGWKAK